MRNYKPYDYRPCGTLGPDGMLRSSNLEIKLRGAQFVANGIGGMNPRTREALKPNWIAAMNCLLLDSYYATRAGVLIPKVPLDWQTELKACVVESLAGLAREKGPAEMEKAVGALPAEWQAEIRKSGRTFGKEQELLAEEIAK